MPASAGAATAPHPLKPPSFSVRLVTRDPVAVLQKGSLVARLTASNTASVRLQAFAKDGARTITLAPAHTFRFRARKRSSRMFALPLKTAGRRALNTCFSMRITFVAKARGFGSPGLKTRRHTPTRTRRSSFVCRNGKIVALTGSSTGGTTQPSGGSTGQGGSGGSGTGGSAGAPSYRAGIAVEPLADGILKSDGTYKGEKVYLGGFGFGNGTVPVEDGRFATGILDIPGYDHANGPQVRGFAVSDGKHPFVIGDIEVQGWFTAFKSEVGPYGLIDLRERVAKDLGISAQQVFIQSDHTHGGADALGVWGFVPFPYIARMSDNIVTALERAYSDQRPGRLYYGSVDARDLINNQFDYDAANQTMDSGLRVLQARDPEGNAFATLLDFSSHADVVGSGNRLITGDWVQAVNPLLEKRFGGKAMTVVGTLGRTQPARPGCTSGNGSGAACELLSYAKQVDARAQQAVDAAKPIDGTPVVDAHSYLITDPSSNALILGAGVAGGPAGLPFERSLMPPWLTGNVLGTVVGTARIGDVLMSSVPGEIYPQIALKVRDTVKGIRAGGFMTAGLSNDQLGYILAPFPEAYTEPIKATAFGRDPANGDQVGCLPTGQTDFSGKLSEFPNCQQVLDPIGNDNYFFNVSHTLGERVTCALLRGAGEVLGKGLTFRDAYDRCSLFPNDTALAPGSDINPTPATP